MMKRLMAIATLALAVPAAAADYYWYDGQARRSLRVDGASVAEFGKAKVGGQQPAMRKSLGAVDPRRLDEGTSPVFVDATSPGSARRALPGGVVLTLKAPMSADALEAALAAFGTRPLRALGGDGRRWIVAGDAGIGSLELANRLHESGQFESASPNWWRERALK